jgi:hypothetical protein
LKTAREIPKEHLRTDKAGSQNGSWTSVSSEKKWNKTSEKLAQSLESLPNVKMTFCNAQEIHARTQRGQGKRRRAKKKNRTSQRESPEHRLLQPQKRDCQPEEKLSSHLRSYPEEGPKGALQFVAWAREMRRRNEEEMNRRFSDSKCSPSNKVVRKELSNSPLNRTGGKRQATKEGETSDRTEAQVDPRKRVEQLEERVHNLSSLLEQSWAENSSGSERQLDKKFHNVKKPDDWQARSSTSRKKKGQRLARSSSQAFNWREHCVQDTSSEEGHFTRFSRRRQARNECPRQGYIHKLGPNKTPRVASVSELRRIHQKLTEEFSREFGQVGTDLFEKLKSKVQTSRVFDHQGFSIIRPPGSFQSSRN